MSDAKVRGIIHWIDETKTYGEKGFRKRTVVLEQDLGRFTNFIPLEFIQDGCDAVDELNVGDDVEIAYRLTGRRWQKDSQSEVKFFLNAEAREFTVLKGKNRSTEADANEKFAEAADDGDEPPF